MNSSLTTTSGVDTNHHTPLQKRKLARIIVENLPLSTQPTMAQTTNNAWIRSV